MLLEHGRMQSASYFYILVPLGNGLLLEESLSHLAAHSAACSSLTMLMGTGAGAAGPSAVRNRRRQSFSRLFAVTFLSSQGVPAGMGVHGPGQGCLNATPDQGPCEAFRAATGGPG